MKVMIVDDSSFIVLICRQAMIQWGHEVVAEAYDGKAAIEKAKNTNPDFVILDLALPYKNGFEVAESIRSFLPQVQILFISAVEESWAQERIQKYGGMGFLAKPFETKDLEKYVKTASLQTKELKYG